MRSMRRLLGLDPGPTTSGLVLYCVGPDGHRRVIRAYPSADLEQVRMEIDALQGIHDAEVVCECTQAGPPSTSVVKTTEVVGRIMERCHMAGVPCHTYYRREVLQALHCARKGNKDSLVRAALIEMHGGDKSAAVGNKKNPGPLHGVSSHAWQALGVVVTHTIAFGDPWAQRSQK